jgi:four helix bundle protein
MRDRKERNVHKDHKGSYKDLEVYRLAHELAVECHQVSLSLPGFEKFEEGSQLRRSAKSVSSLIVEGFGRRHYKAEFVKFLIYSKASCDETKEHIEMLYDTQSLTDKAKYDKLMSDYKRLGAKLSRFIDSVLAQHKSR